MAVSADTRALRVALTGLCCVAATEYAVGIAELWIMLTTVGPLIGAVGQWCLSRGLEEDSQ